MSARSIILTSVLVSFAWSVLLGVTVVVGASLVFAEWEWPIYVVLGLCGALASGWLVMRTEYRDNE